MCTRVTQPSWESGAAASSSSGSAGTLRRFFFFLLLPSAATVAAKSSSAPTANLIVPGSVHRCALGVPRARYALVKREGRQQLLLLLLELLRSLLAVKCKLLSQRLRERLCAQRP
jgi:hypothetical protein